MTAIIFDLDGTLVDSAAAIRDIANLLMAEIGLAPLDEAEARSYIGNGAPKFLERTLAARNVTVDQQQAAALLERFEEHYATAPGEANTPMPGVQFALEALQAAGKRLAICTNKPGAPTHVVLNALGWREVFSAVVAGDSIAERKPHPAPLLEAARLLGVSPALYVGDSEVDAATAKAAGLPFFFYTLGYRKTPVAELPHTVAFSDFTQLPLLIAEHLRSGAAKTG